MSGSLIRASVLRLSGAPLFRSLVDRSGIASRFVAGETLGDALEVARGLANSSMRSMLDHLGENTITEEGARAATQAYVEAARATHADPALDGAISLKLTQLGLDLSYDLCRENAERILAEAGSTMVMLDMESHPYTDRTLRLYGDLHGVHHSFGVCLQAYLRRTAADLDSLPPSSIIRLVKGAYLEPRELALSSRQEVRRAFGSLFATLLARGHRVHVATHDPRLVERARQFVEHHGLPWERVEFQMLYGIRRDLQERLVAEGSPVRVYVPYGTEWYPYLTRRLAERPANLWFFLSNLARSRR